MDTRDRTQRGPSEQEHFDLWECEVRTRYGAPHIDGLTAMLGQRPVDACPTCGHSHPGGC
jgi:hypothetical protein